MQEILSGFLGKFTDILNTGRFIFYSVAGFPVAFTLGLIAFALVNPSLGLSDTVLSYLGVITGSAWVAILFLSASTVAGFIVAPLGYALIILPVRRKLRTDRRLYPDGDDENYSVARNYTFLSDKGRLTFLISEYFRFVEIVVYIPLGFWIGGILISVFILSKAIIANSEQLFLSFGATSLLIILMFLGYDLFWRDVVIERSARAYERAKKGIIDEDRANSTNASGSSTSQTNGRPKRTETLAIGLLILGSLLALLWLPTFTAANPVPYTTNAEPDLYTQAPLRNSCEIYRPQLLVMTALQLELSPFLQEGLSRYPIVKVNEIGREFYLINEMDLLAVAGGRGKTNAAMTAQLSLSSCPSIKQIVFMGIAGGLIDDLEIGDVVVGAESFHHDWRRLRDISNKQEDVVRPEAGNLVTTVNYHIRYDKRQPDELWKYPPQDTSEFYQDPRGNIVINGIACYSDPFFLAGPSLLKASANAKRSASTYQVRLGGRIASGDQFIGSKSEASWINETYVAHAVEMEGAAVAQVACMNGRHHLIVRGISDRAGETKGTADSKKAAENAADFVKLMLHEPLE